MGKEKILLVVIDYKQARPGSGHKGWSVEDLAHEMTELAIACHGEVLETVICRIDKPSAPYLIGEGKVREIAGVAALLGVDTVIFDHELKGSQQRNLEEVIKTKTIDRTQLILDIFARRATSQEGKMQVELAQLEYLLPRLVGKGIVLSRLGGGIGTLGPGETKLEVDRRRIAERIAKLKRGLKEVSNNHAIKRKRRRDQGVPVISLVGYTNAGKSTLLNIFTEAEQVTKDGMFTTLDSLTRQYVLPNHQKVIVSDTVGFMHQLPHHLIEAFHTTLEEVIDADLLLHVLDISNPNYRNLYDSVIDVLQDLGVRDHPVITVLNKVDQLEDASWLGDLQRVVDNAIPLSAKTGENLPVLIEQIMEQLSSLIVDVDLFIPIDRMDLVNLAHKEGQVFSVKYYNDAIHIRAALPPNLAGKLEKVQVSHTDQ